MPITNTQYQVNAPKKRVSAVVDAENEFTKDNGDSTTQASAGTAGILLYGYFVVVLTGTWTATVTVQRSTDNGVTWQDVTTGVNSATAVAMTNNGQRVFYEPARDVKYRVGVKTGDFGSGDVEIEIQQ